jgi:4-hydroxy-tetrahydrodipicolinate synthase
LNEPRSQPPKLAEEERSVPSLPRLSGVHPILYAFYGPDGRLDRAALERQVDACLGAGCHGIALLGLVTEVFRLSTEERLDLVGWAAARIAGRVPLMATVAEVSVHGQLDFITEAKRRGADWVVLQPPPVRACPSARSSASSARSRTALPARWCAEQPAEHGGLRLQRCAARPAPQPPEHPLHEGGRPCGVGRRLRAGGVPDLRHLRRAWWDRMAHQPAQRLPGLIPAPELVDAQVEIWRLWSSGETERAEALHRAVLPIIAFMSRALPLLVAYGKRLMAMRMGLETVHARLPNPASRPSASRRSAASPRCSAPCMPSRAPHSPRH